MGGGERKGGRSQEMRSDEGLGREEPRGTRLVRRRTLIDPVSIFSIVSSSSSCLGCPEEKRTIREKVSEKDRDGADGRRRRWRERGRQLTNHTQL